MSLLASLGLGGEPLLLAGAPDGVLPEAAALSPRPSLASSLRTAEPARRIAWWPGSGELTGGALARLAWMLSAAEGEGWLLFDGDDPAPEGLETAVREAGLVLLERRPLTGGEGLRVRPG
jgi:hypothetical protein